MSHDDGMLPSQRVKYCAIQITVVDRDQDITSEDAEFSVEALLHVTVMKSDVLPRVKLNSTSAVKYDERSNVPIGPHAVLSPGVLSDDDSVEVVLLLMLLLFNSSLSSSFYIFSFITICFS